MSVHTRKKHTHTHTVWILKNKTPDENNLQRRAKKKTGFDVKHATLHSHKISHLIFMSWRWNSDDKPAQKKAHECIEIRKYIVKIMNILSLFQISKEILISSTVFSTFPNDDFPRICLIPRKYIVWYSLTFNIRNNNNSNELCPISVWTYEHLYNCIVSTIHTSKNEAWNLFHLDISTSIRVEFNLHEIRFYWLVQLNLINPLDAEASTTKYLLSRLVLNAVKMVEF